MLVLPEAYRISFLVTLLVYLIFVWSQIAIDLIIDKLRAECYQSVLFLEI